MEGSLHKWTNYYSGWQPRWFVLEGGVLSYYASSTEVQQGSKGSIKIASCDIIAHHKDNRRIDLVIKGGIHMYLRASSQSERQKWLVAFGSTKQQEVSMETSGVKQGEFIKSRMVNLHLSCQLLVTHIASLKTVLHEPKDINDKKLDELSVALSSKCDEFLNALAECMDLSYDEDQWPEYIQPLSLKQLASPSPMLSGNKKLGGLGSPIVRTPSNGFSADELYSSSPVLPSPKRILPTPDCSFPVHLQKSFKDTVNKSDSINKEDSVVKTGTVNQKSLKETSVSQEETEHDKDDTRVINERDTVRPRSLQKDNQRSPTYSKDIHVPSRSSSELFLTPTSSPLPSPSPSPSPERYETFFSSLPHKFSDIQLIQDKEIPTNDFLQCCSDLVPFFDTLSPTAFGPVKADITGNIEKIHHKYNQDPRLYHTLQDIVKHEVETGTHTAKNSATDALLWLKRAVEFVQTFIAEVAKGEQNLGIAAGTAYNKSLKKYHNWLVRGIFNIAVRAVPYYDDFLKMLGSDGSAEYNKAVIKDMSEFSNTVEYYVNILKQLYQMHKLDITPELY